MSDDCCSYMILHVGVQTRNIKAITAFHGTLRALAQRAATVCKLEAIATFHVPASGVDSRKIFHVTKSQGKNMAA